MIKKLNDYSYSNWNYIPFRFDGVSFRCIQFRYMDIFIESVTIGLEMDTMERCNINEELHIGMRGVFMLIL
jgi:hypothetical protein